jgi:lysophospholipid acyltransferase (LPLAT)-like uncharacterized protein
MTQPCPARTLQKWWQKLAMAVGLFFLRLYWGTLRTRLTPATEEVINGTKKSTIFTFWHNNLFAVSLLNKLLKHEMPMYGLVSPSSDGAWLAALLKAIDIEAIRGSSKRGGISAIENMVRVLSDGAFVTVTPDGPRGPVYKFKRGVAMTAKAAKIDVVIVACKYDHFFSLSTWDGFKIPLPFSRVIVHCKTFRYKDLLSLSVSEMTDVFEKALVDLQKMLDDGHLSDNRGHFI